MSRVYFDKKKIDITPKSPISMIGYFNNRISEGILDPLYVRILALTDSVQSFLFIQIDTCLFSFDYATVIKKGISEITTFSFNDIMVFASHTHTGPALESFFETKEESRYKEWLKNQIINATKLLNATNECSIKVSNITYNDLNSNRRWFMKDGRLLTNPPKGNPDILKPEGPVDRELRTFIVEDNIGLPQVIIANISNHTDTIGGNLISADWSGFMEKRVQSKLGKDTLVIPAIAPAGDINHFDFFDSRNQTSYLEAERIGNAYGDIVIRGVEDAERVMIDKLCIEYTEALIPSREIEKKELDEARNYIKKFADIKVHPEELTAEDLAEGNTYVEMIFKKELLKYAKNRKEKYKVPFQAFFIESSKNEDKSISFIGIPGEPFVEIGIELKKINGYKLIMPITLANGYYGYIPLEKHFKHGGYEVLTTPFNCLSKKAGYIITNEYKRILEDYKNR